VSIEFHYPSEHTINGIRYDLEMRINHEAISNETEATITDATV
jgi:carbonic anhydrase